MNLSKPLNSIKKWTANKLDVENAVEFYGKGNNNVLNNIISSSPWNASEPKDMRAYSSYYNVPNDCSGNPGPGIHKFLSQSEEDCSLEDYPDFSYYINDLGFRDPYPSMDAENIMGFFGCSFTWGEGLDTTTNFPHIVSNHFQCPHLNFGVGGSGAQRIALTFAAAANIWPMKTAVVTLPNWARFHYVDKLGHMKRIHLPHPMFGNRELEKVRESVISSFSDAYMIGTTKDAINSMLTVSKLKNIKLVIATWCVDTSLIIEAITGKPVLKYFPTAQESHEMRGIDSPGMYARDSKNQAGHPGPLMAKNFSNRLIKVIEDLH
jgi:hypothetical protein